MSRIPDEDHSAWVARMRALAAEDAAAARPTPPFRTYGLAAPELAPQALAESHQRNGVWQSVVLTHGDWAAPHGPLVRVTTCSPEPGQPDRGASWDLLRELEEEHGRAAEHSGAELPGPAGPPEFAPVHLTVDGTMMSGLMARQDGLWAARIPVDELTLLVVGRGVEPDLVRLASVADLAPYWLGRDEMIGRMSARYRARPKPVLTPAEGAEAFRILIDVTLADQARHMQESLENRTSRSGPWEGPRRHALWQRAVDQQMERSGSGYESANDLVTLVVNLVGHLNEKASWFTEDPLLREGAIDETLRYHLFGEEVPSREAQEAWRRYWTEKMSFGGSPDGRRPGRDLRAARRTWDWLEEWADWARRRS